MPVHHLDVPEGAESVPTGRHFVTSVLGGAVEQTVVEAAELVATELLTNALLHGRPPVRLTVRCGDGTARIEVHDASSALPVRPRETEDATTGRGLALVQALARRWGTVPADVGKLVWAELTTLSAAGGDPVDVDVDALLAAYGDEDDALQAAVSLPGVPTELLLTTEGHVDSLVRELELAAAGAASGMTTAGAGQLATHVREAVAAFAEVRSNVKRQAVRAADRGEARMTLRLALPSDAADLARRYLEALEEADSYARAARLLTLAARPQHAVFRRWYVTALVSAADAAVTLEEHLLAEVDHLGELQAVSERAVRLQRVSAELAAGLDHDEVTLIALEAAVAALAAPRGLVLVNTGRGLRVGANVGLAAGQVRALNDLWSVGGQSPGTVAVQWMRPVWIESRQELVEQFAAFADLEPDTAATAAVPLVASGRAVGVLRLSYRESRVFSTDEQAFLAALAAVAAQAIERADLYDAQAAIGDVALHLGAATTVDDVTRVVIERGLAVLGADGGAVCVRDDARGTIRLAMSASLGPDVQLEYGELPLDGPLPGSYTALTGTTVLLPTRQSGLDFSPAMAVVYDGTGRAAWASLPLRAGDRLLGSLVVSWTGERLFTPQDEELLGAFAAQCAQALDRVQTLEAERRAAAAGRRLSETLQRSLLTRPPERDDLQVAVRYAPASEEAQVGGDWYDAFFTRDGALSLVIGDCTGHDREAVAAMAAVRNLLRATAYAVDGTPAAVLTALEHTMAGLDVPALATALLARVEQEADGTSTMVWSSAGHIPPLVHRADGSTVVLHSPPDLMLGLLPTTERVDHRMAIAPGTTVVLCTDGLIERRGEDLDGGIERLRGGLAEVGDRSLDDVCDALLSRLGADAEDDVALLAVRFGR